MAGYYWLAINHAFRTMTPYELFLQDHPAYAATSALDTLRASEYGRLDARDQVYLDYTGGGLHAARQVR